MKKIVLLIVVFIAAGFIAYKLLSDKPVQPGGPKDQPLRIARNSGAFDSAFAQLMEEYFVVRDALVEWDTLKADKAAYTLAGEADSLPVRMLKADSNIVMTARSLAASLGGDAKAFPGGTGFEDRRQSFNMMTEELYNLVRTVRFDGYTIYHIRCPMAFKDSVEGYWLSNTSSIVNPYLGDKHPVYKAKMIGCGEVVDSFNLAKK